MAFPARNVTNTAPQRFLQMMFINHMGARSVPASRRFPGKISPLTRVKMKLNAALKKKKSLMCDRGSGRSAGTAAAIWDQSGLQKMAVPFCGKAKQRQKKTNYICTKQRFETILALESGNVFILLTSSYICTQHFIHLKCVAHEMRHHFGSKRKFRKVRTS